MFLHLLSQFGHQENGRYVSIDTQKMINFISKYGVDAIDCSRLSLLDFIYMMTNEQIDILFDHKPNLFLDNGLPFIPIHQTNNMYVYEKIIECDSQGDLIRKKYSFYYDGSLYSVLEYVEDLEKIYHWGNLIPSLKKLLYSHRNKTFSLFEMMLAETKQFQ